MTLIKSLSRRWTRWTGFVLFAHALLACAARQGPQESPAEVGRLLTENLLARDFMTYGGEALHYAEAATAVGALRFAAATGDEVAIDQLLERYEPLLDDGSELVSRRPHVDLNLIGIVPLQLAMLRSDPRYLSQGLSFADSQWEDPLPDGLTRQSRYWIDDLYMVGMLQIQAYRATGNPVYADRAARQLAAYLPRLQQESGLFYHSPDVPILWGRGNGWVAAAMAEVLASLPRDHEEYDEILRHYHLMMQALRTYQREDGMWRQVIDHEPAWAESSGTAMFAYAMAVGINKGLLDPEVYGPVVDRTWRGLMRHIDGAGNVADVCIGTAKENDLQYYLDRPRVSGDLHGQAPLLWLATELLTHG
jgi:unsaturated rhamnogalacturonyl hydrolase